jgi:ribosome modulation factor
MGVAETSPSVPRKDGEATYKTSRRARPDRLERAQARGLDARLHPLGRTKCRRCQMHARGTAEAGWNIADAG